MSTGADLEPVVFSGGRYDRRNRRVLRADGEVSLSPTEVRLLDYLLAHAGEELSFRRLLQEVWGYSPNVETRTVYSTTHRLRQKIELDPSDPQHLLAVPGVGYRFVLPRPPPPAPAGLYGRARELAELRARLAQGRLVALVGLGGVGKTTLARALGEGLMVELAASSEPADLPAALAGALGLEGTPSVVRIGRALAARGPTLVVLDEVEGIATQLDAVTTWLELAPEARFLLTSRVPPALDGVVVLPLHPLPLPEAGRAEGPAVELFLARARAARPGFAVEAAGEAAIVALARRLDGLPLALELAAARMAVLSPAELLSRVDASASLLRRRGDLGRHGSLDAVLESTFALLDPYEQAALAQAGVFAGGFSLEAAEAVIVLEGGAPPLLDVLEGLAAVALLQVVEAEPTRYHLLETVRAFARTRQADPDAVLRRHAAWCARYGTDDWARAARGAGGAALARQARRDRENVLAAAAFALGTADPGLAAAAVMAADTVLGLTGPLAQASALTEQALALDLEPSARARLLLSLGHHRTYLGQAQEALPLLDEVSRISEEKPVLGRAASARGMALSALGRLDESLEAHASAIALLRASPRPEHAWALVLRAAALRYVPGRDEEALASLEEALSAARLEGNRIVEGAARGYQALVELNLGRMGEAWLHARAAVERMREDRRDSDRIFALLVLAKVALEGEPAAARTAILEARALARRTGDLAKEAVTWRDELVLGLSDGDRPGALLAGDQVILILASKPADSLLTEVRVLMALGHLLEGHPHDAECQVARARQGLGGAVPELAPVVAAVGALARARARPPEARAARALLEGLGSADGVLDATILAVRAHLDLDLGDPEEARATLTAMEADPRRIAQRAQVRFLVDELRRRLAS